MSTSSSALGDQFIYLKWILECPLHLISFVFVSPAPVLSSMHGALKLLKNMHWKVLLLFILKPCTVPEHHKIKSDFSTSSPATTLLYISAFQSYFSVFQPYWNCAYMNMLHIIRLLCLFLLCPSPPTPDEILLFITQESV